MAKQSEIEEVMYDIDEHLEKLLHAQNVWYSQTWLAYASAYSAPNIDYQNSTTALVIIEVLDPRLRVAKETK